MREQLNVRISKRLRAQVTKDRKTSGKTNDIVAEVALEFFFTKLGVEDRLKFYKAHDRTPYARVES